MSLYNQSDECMRNSKVQLPGFAELLRSTEDARRGAQPEQLPPILSQFEGHRGPESVPESSNQRSPASSFHSFKSEPSPSATSSYIHNGQFQLPTGIGSRVQNPETRQLHSGDHGIHSTGWLDTDNWLFKIVWDAASHYTVEELTEKFFGRRQRPVYGETHKSSLRKTEAGRPSSAQRWHKSSKDKSKENHQQQERHRRKRHRVLQRESDGCVGDFIFALANDKLPYVKAMIRDMFPEDDSDNEGTPFTGRSGTLNTGSVGKNTGKDENLLSAVFTHIFSAIVVLKQNHQRLETEQMLQEIRRENQQLRDELRELQSRGVETSHPYLIADTLSRKRAACDA